MLLPPLCVCLALSFLNIKDRAEARLACRTLLELCPAPWKSATLLLDECVAWHDSFQCPQCEHRLDLEGGRCELCPEPSFPNHPPIGRGGQPWAYSDPRFTKVYAALKLQVRGEPDAKGPDAWRGGTQRELFKLMWRFALRSVQRLQRHFVVQIQRNLAARAMLTGRPQWNWGENLQDPFCCQLIECFGHLRVGGKKIPSARWQLMWAFAEMNFAAWELFSSQSLYWCKGTADRVDWSWGSSHSAGVSGFISDPFGELGGDPPGTPCVNELVGKAPGSDAHLEYLLRQHPDVQHQEQQQQQTTVFDLLSMFGTELDVLAPFKKVWPALRVLVDKIDAVTVPTSFEIAIDDLFSEFWASTNASVSQVGSEDDDEEFSGSESEDGDGEDN